MLMAPITEVLMISKEHLEEIFLALWSFLSRNTLNFSLEFSPSHSQWEQASFNLRNSIEGDIHVKLIEQIDSTAQE